MRHIIVGCGRLGATLATALADEGHDVTILDRDADALRRLGKTFRGHRIAGVAFDQDVLGNAGINHADGLATVTNSDNTNFVLAAMARWRYQVPRVVARVYDPTKAEIYVRLGIPTVSPTRWGAARIEELLNYAPVTPRLDIADGDVEVVEIEANALLAGRSVEQLGMAETMQVVAIVRGGHGFIPTRSTLVQAHDMLYIAVRPAARGRLNVLVELQ
ncbi:MAG TPA: TrkA family potassium uptake protein [Chloroflexota bacterium]|jgi:trk system potassium uptake protein TrkA